MSNTITGKLITVFLCIVLAWTLISGLTSDVIDVDAAQYASISMEMLQNKSYLKVTERGLDYLDKPPFLFWVNTLSFSIFGLSNFAYKLPSLLFSIIGLFYTMKLGSYLGDVRTGSIAAIITGTSIGFFWIINDVKTDAILTASVIYTLYYLIRFLDSNKTMYLLLGSIGVGIGMLTKGPMALVFPFATLFIHLIFKGEFRKLFRIQWLLLAVVVAVMLLPMCIGLYQQFDLHPEKIIHGKTGVSGLRFYFWEQSFGRITGENQWDNDKPFFFLFGAFLLLVFPYSALVIAAYFQRLRATLRGNHKREYYLLGGSLLILVLLSLSSYKIPHYAAVILPFAGIILAQGLMKYSNVNPPRWLRIHHVIIAGIVSLFSVFSFVVFPIHWTHLLVFLSLLASFAYYHWYKKALKALFVLALTLGFVYNVHLLPAIQEYSEGRRFAEIIKAHNLQHERLCFFNRKSCALEFYLHRYMEVVRWEDIIASWKQGEEVWFYMSLDGKEALLDSGLEVDTEHSLMIKQLTRVDMDFLNPKTRQESLEHRFLIKFKPE